MDMPALSDLIEKTEEPPDNYNRFLYISLLHRHNKPAHRLKLDIGIS